MPQCARIKEITTELARMARDLPGGGIWAEPYGSDRARMLRTAKEAVEALAAATEKLGELRRQAIEHGSTS